MRFVWDYMESVAKEDIWRGETTNRQTIVGERWITLSRPKLPRGHNTLLKDKDQRIQQTVFSLIGR